MKEQKWPSRSAMPFLIVAMLIVSCSKSDHRGTIIGQWELTGSGCDRSGNCTKEIIVDDSSRDVYQKDGIYINSRGRYSYTVDDDTIRFTAGEEASSFKAEIIYIKDDEMLLRYDGITQRYNRLAAEETVRGNQ